MYYRLMMCSGITDRRFQPVRLLKAEEFMREL